MEGIAQHGVQHEELADDVDDEEDLAEYVGDNEVVSEALATAWTTGARHKMGQTQRANPLLFHLSVNQEPAQHKQGGFLSQIVSD